VIEKAKGNIVRTTDPLEAAEGADVLYTDTWISMGKEQEEAQRLNLLRGYQINRTLVEKAKPGAIVLHCLPAYRDNEISEEVFEQFSSVIFDQSENRLHTKNRY